MVLHPITLVIDDEKSQREALKLFLERIGYEVHLAENAAVGALKAEELCPDIILSDIRLPDKDGLSLLDELKALCPDADIFMMTAYGSEETAVRAIKKGAHDYLPKPINLDELQSKLDQLTHKKRLQDENETLRRALESKKGPEEIVAHSQSMKELLEMLQRVSPTNATVLLQGESGTGKEVLAHLIHDWSARSNKPFVPVHCAALTETLLLSELFGHEKGSFTGATERKIGRFESAHEGTLFLDEISEIREDLQVKLLRVLQNGEFERVGSNKTIKADVRVICATNRNLSTEVKAGRFREDLYYRINVIEVKVPALRDRPDDIPDLAKHFVKHFSKANNKGLLSLSQEALTQLCNYSWPGNVRELKNIIERMVVLSNTAVMGLDSVPRDLLINEGGMTGLSFSHRSSAAENRYQIRDMEKELILEKLKITKGNKSKTAKELGISRRTLYRKLEEYGLQDG